MTMKVVYRTPIGKYSRMRLRALLVLVLVPVAALAQRGGVEPRYGLVITRSVRIKPGVWRLPAPASLDSSVLVVQGDDVTVNLTNVTLLGADSLADPDQSSGVAIRVAGGRNVRIIGARIRGYRVGI